jgi:hypothetical protein
MTGEDSNTAQTSKAKKEKPGMSTVNKALFSVVRVEAYQRETGITQNALLWGATGFLYENFNKELFLVTNKHVVWDQREGYRPDFLLIYIRSKREVWSKTKPVRLELRTDVQKKWKGHSDRRIDIAALPLDYKDLPEDMVALPLSHTDILPKEYNFALGSQALVLGFPKGAFYDEFSNFPIARIATIATLPWLAFNKKPCFLIDAKLQEGMSGSPVVSMPRAIYEKDGKATYNDVRCYLMGIFSSEWLWGGEPLGLHTVWSATLIEETTSSLPEYPLDIHK